MKSRLFVAIASAMLLAACSDATNTGTDPETTVAAEESNSGSAIVEDDNYEDMEAFKAAVAEAGISCEAGKELTLENAREAYECANGDVLGLTFNIGYSNAAIDELEIRPEKILRDDSWFLVTQDPEAAQEQLGGEIYALTPFDRAVRACGYTPGIEVNADKTAMTIKGGAEGASEEKIACTLEALGLNENQITSVQDGYVGTEEQTLEWEDMTMTWTMPKTGEIDAEVVRAAK